MEIDHSRVIEINHNTSENEYNNVIENNYCMIENDHNLNEDGGIQSEEITAAAEAPKQPQQHQLDTTISLMEHILIFCTLSIFSIIGKMMMMLSLTCY